MHTRANEKITSAILFFGISVILISSYHAFDSQFSAFAQMPGDPNAGPIPEGNFTITSTGPIPEDNSTDPTIISNPMDGVPDASSMNPDNGTVPSIDNMTSLGNMASPDNMTGPENMSPSPSMNMSSNSTVSGLPPLEQVKSGVSPKDVTCKQGFTLIIKADDGSPACVDPQVMQILIQRGW
ncbi:MAG: hypothetical protein PXX83_03645 [Candidatus Nitrosotalea sp.]|nr:hypothetical protein [Candidatus Nitrosotalea sp.]